jgi:hypothetical protein
VTAAAGRLPATLVVWAIAVGATSIPTATYPPSATATPTRAGSGSTTRDRPTQPRGRGQAVSKARSEPSPRLSHAASGEPLVGGGLNPAVPSSAEEGVNDSARAEADPLVSNGLGSPLCSERSGELSAAGRRNCETSGFVAAAAPTNDYGLDVHIDTGVLGLSSGGLLSAVQDLFVTPLWMALVWLVHALVVMLEWCFQIDLLNSPATGRVGPGLRNVEVILTQPWLSIVLPIAGVIAAYNGLVRRRVSEAVGEALLMGAMMVTGMLVILDPAGTVGAFGNWTNQASLGTLAVTASGGIAGTNRTLADTMGTLFSAAIEAPWCYLEFGNVSWCREPRRLDPVLRGAGLRIAAREQSLSGCQTSPGAGVSCTARDGAQSSSLQHSAELLRRANTNGAIFLALPANGPERNSINEEGSLLRTLCQSAEATACHGAGAAEAQFRTNSGTWARVGGLLLIVAGVLGMLLLLGFIALRLLVSAMFALLYLLLAPAAVLAPALGDRGRAVFRAWTSRLLGSVVSKLMYSFLLGTVLAVAGILVELRGLGWWTQWLLMSAFWWGAYVRRHQMLGLVEGGLVPGRTRTMRSPAQRVRHAISSGLAVSAGLARHGRARPAPDVEPRPASPDARRQHMDAMGDEQVKRSLGHEYADARARLQDSAGAQARLAELRGQLERVRGQRASASVMGNSRRVSTLDARAARIAHEISARDAGLHSARGLVAQGERAQRRAGTRHSREQEERRASFLDAQAALPPAGRRAPDGKRRDYSTLAGLAGYGQYEYERLDASSRRRARLQVDRELAHRKELSGAAMDITGARSPTQRPPVHHRLGRDFDRAVDERLRAGGDRMPPAPAAGRDDGKSDPGKRDGGQSSQWSGVPARARGERPSVMDDAREVAARRKRQLGNDRP